MGTGWGRGAGTVCAVGQGMAPHRGAWGRVWPRTGAAARAPRSPRSLRPTVLPGAAETARPGQSRAWALLAARLSPACAHTAAPRQPAPRRRHSAELCAPRRAVVDTGLGQGMPIAFGWGWARRRPCPQLSPCPRFAAPAGRALAAVAT